MPAQTLSGNVLKFARKNEASDGSRSRVSPPARMYNDCQAISTIGGISQMAAPTQGAKPSPERIFSTLIAFQQTEALKAAIRLDIFTKIGEGADEPGTLAKAAGASERGVRRLCDYLTIFGFLTKEKGRYGLTQDAAVFLDRRSPAY